MDVQDVSLSTTCSLDVHWVSLSPPPTPAEWTCRPQDVSIPPALLTCWAHPFPPLAVLYGRAGCIHSAASSMHVQVVFLSINSSLNVQCVIHFAASSIDVHLFGVYLSTASSTDVQSVSISTPIRMDVQGVLLSINSQQYGRTCTLRLPFHRQQYARAGCISFHSQQYGRAWCIPSHHQQYDLAMCVHFYRQYGHAGCTPVFKCRNVGLSGTEMNKNADAGTSPVPE